VLAAVIFRVAVPDLSRLEGVNVAMIPSDAMTVRSTGSVSPFWKAMSKVAVVEPPTSTWRFSGFTERTKSGLGVTMTLTVIA